MPLILRGVKEVSVYDATGKVVRNLEAKDGNLVWDGRSLTNGIYFLKIKYENGSTTTKAIILR
jgi:flagellar hook assembly protein FlgD